MSDTFTLTLVEVAALLHQMGYDLNGVAKGLASLSAAPDSLAVAQALLDPSLFPDSGKEGLGAALTGAGYSEEEVAATLNTLFPPPVPRSAGPAGRVSGTRFDDTDAVITLGPITELLVRAGEILDGLQATYGAKAGPFHGGLRGSPNTLTPPSGASFTGISGYTGNWFGRNYVLQLTLHLSDGTTQGPFGSMAHSSSQVAFSFQAESGETLVGFNGSYISGVEADGSTTYFMTSLGAVFLRG